MSHRLEDRRPATQPDLLFHRVILLLAIGVFVAAFVLQIRGHNQVIVPIIETPLPGVCTYKRLVGSECPGCGLTRCFVSLAHGDLVRAWSFNPAGLLFFAVVLIQIPYRGAQIWRVRRGLPELRFRRLANLVICLLVAGLLLQWIVRVLLPLLL